MTFFDELSIRFSGDFFDDSAQQGITGIIVGPAGPRCRDPGLGNEQPDQFRHAQILAMNSPPLR